MILEKQDCSNLRRQKDVKLKIAVQIIIRFSFSFHIYFYLTLYFVSLLGSTDKKQR